MSTLHFPTDEGFEKLIYQDANDGLVAACAGMMTNYIGNDGGVKSAASEIFPRHKLAEFTPPKGSFMLHAVAMGSEEAYGPNKNGDAFSKRALEEHHHTFVTNGHMYREHRNRNPETQGIGKIVASAFHPELQRVELILHGDCEKAAAEYEAAKAGKDISFSMSCKVPHDVCSCCANMAKSAAVYCGHLRDHMLQWIPEFQKYAYAKNPDPNFFDMSCVGRPADRIAHSLQTQVLEKAASASRIISGAELAQIEGVHLPGAFSQAVPMTGRRLALLEKLAKAEEWFEGLILSGVQPKDYLSNFAIKVAVNAFDPEKNIDYSDTRIRPGTFFHELSKRACFITPQSLWSYVQGSAPDRMDKKAEVLRHLPHLFRDLHKQASCDGGIGNLTTCCDAGSATDVELDGEYDDSIDNLMDQTDEFFGVGQKSLEPRTINITIVKSSTQPEINTPDEAPGLEAQSFLDLYGVYKLAAVDHIQLLNPTLDEETLALLAVGQNIQLAMSAQSS